MDEDTGGFGSSSDRPMYDAVCTKCGQPCKVPFKPSEGRPVFCRNCYQPRGGGRGGSRGGGRF